jgi:hypothetical protein
MNGRFQGREVKTGFCRNKSMETGSSGTPIGWKSGQTTFVPLRGRMEGAWLCYGRQRQKLLAGTCQILGFVIERNVSNHE